MPAAAVTPTFHPELAAAVRAEAGRAADRVAAFLRRLADRGVAVPPLPRDTLLELAALTLVEWEDGGLTTHTAAGLPDARTGARYALATALPVVRRLDPGLVVHVVGLFADRMAWHARAELGADVALDAADDDALLDRTLDRMPVIDEVVGDKAFDGDALRSACLQRDVGPNIPLKANRDPGKWAWDPVGYKERNRVERLFGKLKQFRRVATRYDKLKATYLGLLHLTLGFIRLRRLTNVNTP